MKPTSLLRLGSLFLVVLGNAFPLLAESPIDFKREIRPILSNRCFACHGPDEEKIESGLQLDSFEGATAKADSGLAAIVPGSPKESELIRRILSDDENDRMPPPHFGGRLTPTEIEKLKKWVEAGAGYSKHWSFDSVQTVDLSKAAVVAGFESWNSHPVDRLLLKTLHEKGWTPSQEADRRTLIRRVALDLTGLPPTWEQQRRLLEDTDPLSYERWVDELLASPAYGEHWAWKWLDLARYADSAGYADDPERTIWGYRDWVIRAINDGMPFDQFTIDQLAGDLLPNPTDDQLVATAFHRNTLTNNEGGTNDEEFRNVAVVDRVNTTMSVWMGVTMACAQCHSHKFDPISQKEYFQVFAILNQSEDADRRDESPIVSWFTPEQRYLRNDLLREQKWIEAKLQEPDPSLVEKQREWEQRLIQPIDWKGVVPEATAQSKAPMKVDASGKIRVDTEAQQDGFVLEWPVEKASELPKWSGLAIQTVPDPELPGGGAAVGNGNFVLTDVRAKVIATDSKGIDTRFVRIELSGKDRILSLAEVQVFSDDKNIAPEGVATQSSNDFGGVPERAIDRNTSGDYTKNSVTHTAISDSPWWELDLKKTVNVEKLIVWNRTDGSVGNRLDGARIDFLDESRAVQHSFVVEKAKDVNTTEIVPSISIKWKIASVDHSQPGFDGAFAIDQDQKSGWAVGDAINKPHELRLAIDQGDLATQWKAWNRPAKIRVELDFRSPHVRHILSSFRVLSTSDERVNEILSLPDSIQKLLNRDAKGPKGLEQSDASVVEDVHRYYVSEIAPERKSLRDKRTDIEKKLAALKPATTVPIMRELPKEKSRTTYVQLRGNYKVHGDQVQPGLPMAFHRFQANDKTSPLNRLDLANWLIHKDNPLTARVVANRYWEHIFGTGIVRTSEEFGSQGDLPTHPELLDFLASELIRINWDTKAFLRMIVLSSAYKQTSSVSRERFEEDPDNVFLSRGPRFRATAEQIRDSALATSGLLSNRMFGMPTRPPQPSMGLSAAFGSRTDWDTSQGEDRYRRGLYTQWRRSNPYPSMATFDAPNREVCVLKRDRTNTPLQALVTLNDPAYMEAAQGLARRVVLHELKNASFEERAIRIFEHALARAPMTREIEAMRGLFQETFEELKADLGRAKQLATDPLGPLPTGTDEMEIATWTALSNVVLNLDEFLMKR